MISKQVSLTLHFRQVITFEWFHMIELCAFGEQTNTTNKYLVMCNKRLIELSFKLD
jgi:hypothetical protein